MTSPAHLNRQSTVDVVVVGAGLAGIYQLHRLLEDGLKVRSFEAADGVGGVWYWNRYPGARVDSHFPFYQYWFSKELWDESQWTQHFPDQREIEAYLNRVVDKFELRQHITFNTRVVGAEYDETAGRWTVTTDTGETVLTQFLVLNSGGLSDPKIPPFKGHETFGGTSLHTSRWPKHDIDLSNKRVGIFGNGATGIQVIQTIAPIVGKLTVFQRTPQYALPMKNPAVTEQELKTMRESYETLKVRTLDESGGGFDFTPAPMFADVPPEQHETYLQGLWELGNLSLWGNAFADFQINPEAVEVVTRFIKKKIRARIKDPKLADKLIPNDYPFGTRRVPLENGYFEAFNRDNVELVDMRSDPLIEIDATGVQTASGHRALDVIIYATGFDAGIGSINKIAIRGPDGVLLKDHWDKALRTTVGMMVHGYPNLFMTHAPFAPVSAICNVPVCVDHQCNWIADSIGHVRGKGLKSISPSEAVETEWMDHHNAVSEPTMIGHHTNSWYRRLGEDGQPRELIAYMGGIPRYRESLNQMLSSGFAGFDLA
jgi:acetone monooxygenase